MGGRAFPGGTDPGRGVEAWLPPPPSVWGPHRRGFGAVEAVEVVGDGTEKGTSGSPAGHQGWVT